MSNGDAQTDREVLLETREMVKAQRESSDRAFTKLENHGVRISAVETEQVRTQGRCVLAEEKHKAFLDALERLGGKIDKAEENRPSMAKWVAITTSIVGLMLALAVFLSRVG